MKVALVYDRVNKWGGAERVLLALHKIFPDAPLYTSVYHPKKAQWAKVFDVRPSFLQKFPLANSHHELYAVLMPLAFESFDFDEYDLVISVTSEAAKGIITKPETLHICYCLTPTRYLWSGYEDYFENQILRFISRPIITYLRAWDRAASQRPDMIIAISKEVKTRIKKYYGRDSEIIYPPATLSLARRTGPPIQIQNSKSQITNKFQITNSKTNNKERRTNNYFLIVSRLVPYKKIDLAVKVFNKLNLPLKIVGKGSEESKLKAIANENIEFLGYLTDEELVKYYRECRALIFPGKEDLGLTILEAQSFGKPVIAFRGGGALETIIEGKTGIFFDSSNQKSLEEALLKFMKKKFDPRDCTMQAERFNIKAFSNQLKEEIERLIVK